MIYLITELGMHSVSQLEQSILQKYGSLELLRADLLQKGVSLYSNGGMEDDREDDNPVSYTLMGNVAVLGINGATRASTNWLTRFCSIPTYEDIKLRYQQAYEDPSAKMVLNDIKSPGGEAAGTGSLSRFIENFNNKIKPVASFTGGTMMSAAMWYGTAGQAVIADEDAELGSIGAVRPYITQFRALQQEGIDVEIIRSAPLKAFPTSMEPMSAKGKEVLQEQVTTWANKFIDGLAHNLDTTPAALKKNAASGKEFTSQQALSLGLINKILPFDQLIANLNAKFDNR